MLIIIKLILSFYGLKGGCTLISLCLNFGLKVYFLSMISVDSVSKGGLGILKTFLFACCFALFAHNQNIFVLWAFQHLLANSKNLYDHLLFVCCLPFWEEGGGQESLFLPYSALLTWAKTSLRPFLGICIRHKI